MLPTLIFCIIAYFIVTHQSRQSDSTARTWLRYILRPLQNPPKSPKFPPRHLGDFS